VFTKIELLGYVDYCRAKVRQALDALSDDKTAQPLPKTHRYRGVSYGEIVGSIPLHVIEHAAQIRQFLTTEGIEVQPVPGDRGYVE
jgi:hypothetical protein